MDRLKHFGLSLESDRSLRNDFVDVEFVDDESVSQLGELCIDIGKPFSSVEGKTVKVSLLFGNTHIYATATNKFGTEIKNCEFKFDTEGV